jgi:hypothetical protein
MDAPGGNNGGKVDAVKKFLESDAKVLVCTHATFRFAVDKFGVDVLDDRLIAVDQFHHVSANPEGRLPSLTAVDPWEKRMAEGIAFLQRKVKKENDA